MRLNVSRQSGVSLLELLIGIVILGIVLLGVSLFYLAQPRQLDAVFQFRAVSLVEALAEQVLSVKYDANNNSFEQKRCGVDPNLVCKNDRESDHLTLNSFDNLDDFKLWCDKHDAEGIPIEGAALAEQLGLTRTELYQRFTISTCVEPISATGLEPAYKKVSIKVSINSGADITFQLQRYNIR